MEGGWILKEIKKTLEDHIVLELTRRSLRDAESILADFTEKYADSDTPEIVKQILEPYMKEVVRLRKQIAQIEKSTKKEDDLE